MGKRIYQLEDGTIIPSAYCLGFLHTAKSDKGTTCMGCDEEVKKDQQYITLNIFGGSDPIHKDCYVADHPDECIVGIKIKHNNAFGLLITSTIVICRDLVKEVKK